MEERLQQTRLTYVAVLKRFTSFDAAIRRHIQHHVVMFVDRHPEGTKKFDALCRILKKITFCSLRLCGLSTCIWSGWTRQRLFDRPLIIAKREYLTYLRVQTIPILVKLSIFSTDLPTCLHHEVLELFKNLKKLAKNCFEGEKAIIYFGMEIHLNRDYR